MLAAVLPCKAALSSRTFCGRSLGVIEAAPRQLDKGAWLAIAIVVASQTPHPTLAVRPLHGACGIPSNVDDQHVLHAVRRKWRRNHKGVIGAHTTHL